MARIAGVDLPREKKVEIGLTYIFGIGRKTAREILAKTGVDAQLRIKDLVEADVNKLRQIIERDYRVEGALRTEVAMNIKRLMDIGSYRGTRHRRGLPVIHFSFYIIVGKISHAQYFKWFTVKFGFGGLQR